MADEGMSISDILLIIVGLGAVGLLAYLLFGEQVKSVCIKPLFMSGTYVNVREPTPAYKEPDESSEVVIDTVPPFVNGKLIHCKRNPETGIQYWYVEWYITDKPDYGYVREDLLVSTEGFTICRETGIDLSKTLKAKVNSKVYKKPDDKSEVVHIFEKDTKVTVKECIYNMTEKTRYYLIGFIVPSESGTQYSKEGYIKERDLFTVSYTYKILDDPEHPLGTKYINNTIESVDFFTLEATGSDLIKPNDIVITQGKKVVFYEDSTVYGEEGILVSFKGRIGYILTSRFNRCMVKTYTVKIKVQRENYPTIPSGIGVETALEIFREKDGVYESQIKMIKPFYVYGDRYSVVEVDIPTVVEKEKIAVYVYPDSLPSYYSGTKVYIETGVKELVVEYLLRRVLLQPRIKVKTDAGFSPLRYYADIGLFIYSQNREVYYFETSILENQTEIRIEPSVITLIGIPVFYDKTTNRHYIDVSLKLIYGGKVGEKLFYPKREYIKTIKGILDPERGWKVYIDEEFFISYRHWIPKGTELFTIFWAYDIDKIPSPTEYYTDLRLDLFGQGTGEEYIGIDRMTINKLSDIRGLSITKRAPKYTAKISVVDDYDRVLKSWWAYNLETGAEVKLTLKVTDLPRRRYGVT